MIRWLALVRQRSTSPSCSLMPPLTIAAALPAQAQTITQLVAILCDGTVGERHTSWSHEPVVDPTAFSGPMLPSEPASEIVVLSNQTCPIAKPMTFVVEM